MAPLLDMQTWRKEGRAEGRRQTRSEVHGKDKDQARAPSLTSPDLPIPVTNPFWALRKETQLPTKQNKAKL